MDIMRVIFVSLKKLPGICVVRRVNDDLHAADPSGPGNAGQTTHDESA